MRTSIIIVNKDDRGLQETLAALAGYDHEVEILVVDASEGRLDDIRRRFGDVRWIEFAPIKGRPTIPHQRNVGVAASRGEIVVFLDASCVPDPGWLPALLESIVSGEESIVSGSHRSVEGDGLRDETTRRLAVRDYVREAPTINLAVARGVFASVGMFDEEFRYGSDVDFTWRALDTGHRIRYRPDSCVTHDWGSPRAEMRRSYLYGQARARLYAKHRRRWRDLLGVDVVAVAYPGFLLTLPFWRRRPWILLLLVVPAARNRGRKPVVTVAEHLVYGAGVLRGLVGIARDRGMPSAR